MLLLDHLLKLLVHFGTFTTNCNLKVKKAVADYLFMNAAMACLGTTSMLSCGSWNQTLCFSIQSPCLKPKTEQNRALSVA